MAAVVFPSCAYPFNPTDKWLTKEYLTGYWDGWDLTGAKSDDSKYLEGYDDGMREIMQEYAS